MKRIVAMFIASMVMILGFTLFLPLGMVRADTKSAICEGAGLVVGANGCTTSSQAEPEVESVLQRGLNIFSAILGIIAVVMFMVGGLKYMTAQGDSGQLNSAKNTLIFAAVGLVVVMLAQTIAKFVVERFVK